MENSKIGVSGRRKIVIIALSFVIAIVFALLVVRTANTNGVVENGFKSDFYASGFSLLPPVIAIGMALVTKEVYSSLFTGICVGAMLYSEGNLELFYNTLLYSERGGLVTTITKPTNASILVFVVMLSWVTALINKSGAARAFGDFAKKHIKTRVGAQLSTMLLGVLIFIDDYFNCLTVGSVMKPVTDEYKISRAKLSYLIDATAAPICIIAPVSSWAAAVTNSVPQDSDINGFIVFLHTIPYNFYAILTLAFMISMITMNVEFGEMRKHEENALRGDLFTTKDHVIEEPEKVKKENGHILDLVVPIVFLISSAVFFMLYTGGFFKGVDFITAFSGCESAKSLVMASLLSIIFIFCFYGIRNIITFSDFMDGLPEGFKNMCGAVIILILAWTLSSMTSLLGANVFIHDMVANQAAAIKMFLPFILFIVSVLLAFATGSSWGTFTVLIPIVCDVFTGNQEILAIAIAAVLSGSICGDHCSPISDTTIMSSAGAGCPHVNHVSTQLPYAILVASVSALGFLFAGIIGYITETKIAMVCMPVMIAVIILIVFILRKKQMKAR